MTTAESRRAEISDPRVVSLDDHVIEPPDVWAARLPARYRDVGPRVEDLPLGTAVLDGGKFKEQPGTDGPLVSYWRYEDLFMSVKRLSTAVGLPRRPRSRWAACATTRSARAVTNPVRASTTWT